MLDGISNTLLAADKTRFASSSVNPDDRDLTLVGTLTLILFVGSLSIRNLECAKRKTVLTAARYFALTVFGFRPFSCRR